MSAETYELPADVEELLTLASNALRKQQDSNTRDEARDLTRDWFKRLEGTPEGLMRPFGAIGEAASLIAPSEHIAQAAILLVVMKSLETGFHCGRIWERLESEAQ